MDDSAPAEVRHWTAQRVKWLEIRRTVTADPLLTELDAGERSAIALAELEAAVLLLIDEAAGRAEATRRGIPNTGTLGVLRVAAIDHLVDLPRALGRLLATNFRISRALIADLLAEDAERKRRATEET